MSKPKSQFPNVKRYDDLKPGMLLFSTLDKKLRVVIEVVNLGTANCYTFLELQTKTMSKVIYKTDLSLTWGKVKILSVQTDTSPTNLEKLLKENKIND